MSRIKIISALIFIGGGLFLFTRTAWAGVSVSYPGAGVGDPIFNETNWAPGSEVSKKVTFTNNDEQPRSIDLTVPQEPTGKLAKKLEISITDNKSYFYGPKTLEDFYSDSPISLPDIPPKTTQDYYFKIEFDSQAGNEYQDETIIFDLVFYFEGDVTYTVAPAAFPGPRGDGTLDLATPAEFIKGKVVKPVVEAVEEVTPSITLPPTLPRVGAWSAFILAGAGLVWEIIAYRRRKK